jgi:hypothetical protein
VNEISDSMIRALDTALLAYLKRQNAIEVGWSPSLPQSATASIIARTIPTVAPLTLPMFRNSSVFAAVADVIPRRVPSRRAKTGVASVV